VCPLFRYCTCHTQYRGYYEVVAQVQKPIELVLASVMAGCFDLEPGAAVLESR